MNNDNIAAKHLSIIIDNEDIQEGPNEGTALLSNKRISTVTPNNKINIITFKEALKHVFLFVAPFSLSRFAVTANNIGNGIVFAQLGADEVSAGPIITTMQFVIMGTIRGSLLASGILIGGKYGAQKHSKIGRLVNQGLLVGTVLSIPSIAIFTNSKSVLTFVGVPHTIAKIVQDYFIPFSYGIPPILWLVTDQQFALGIKKPTITLITGATYALLTMTLGYPLALGALSLPKLGVAGMGYGSSAAAWLTFIGLRLYYYLKSDFKKFNLFNLPDKKTISKLRSMLSLSFPMGVQVLTEWGNLFVLSILSANLSKDTLTAEQASIQLMTSFNLTILGLSQATAVIVSNTYGIAKTAFTQNDSINLNVSKANVKTLGNAGIVLGIILASIAAGTFIIFAKQFTEIFADSADKSEKELSETLLLWMGIGLIIDCARNVAGAGALAGLKRASFAPIASFITMSILGLSAGFTLANVFNWGAEWLFISRDAGIALAAIAILFWWQKQSHLLDLNPASNDEKAPNKCLEYLPCPQAFFKPEKKSERLVINPNTIPQNNIQNPPPTLPVKNL